MAVCLENGVVAGTVYCPIVVVLGHPLVERYRSGASPVDVIWCLVVFLLKRYRSVLYYCSIFLVGVWAVFLPQ